MKKMTSKDLVLLSLLIGLNIVLSRFLSINAWNIKIGFTFVTIYVAAYLYGPIGGVMVGGLGDFIGALLFPTGPYFPGFTLTAILTGLLFGFFLNKSKDIRKIIVICLINELIINLLINTFWISYVYQTSYLILLSTRVIQAFIKSIISILIIKLFSNAMPSLERRLI